MKSNANGSTYQRTSRALEWTIFKENVVAL
jgi:hypothetical protein